MIRWLSSLPLFSGAAENVFRGTAMLTGGLVAGRLIGLVAIPILTRIYDPVDFGALSIYTALIIMISPFAALRYPVAIPLPRSPRMAASVLALSLILTAVTGAALFLLLWAAAPTLLPLLSMGALIPFWWIIPIGVIFSSLYETFSSWAARRKNYRLIARTSVMQSFTGSAVKVGMGFVVAGPLGLLLGQILAIGGGNGALLRHYAAELTIYRGKLRIRKAANLFSTFALYRLPAQALLAAAMQAPVLFVAALYDAATVGQFGLALTVVAVPVTFLVKGLSKAFYAEIAELGLKRLPDIKAITFATTKRLAVIGLPLATAMLVFGREVSMVIFGAEWEQAGRFSELLSLYLFGGLVASPIMRLLDLLREQAFLLIINGIRLALVTGVFLLLPRTGATLETVVLVYAVAMLALQVFAGWLVLHRLSARARNQVEVA